MKGTKQKKERDKGGGRIQSEKEREERSSFDLEQTKKAQ